MSHARDPREIIRRMDGLHQRYVAPDASVRCNCGRWSIGVPHNASDVTAAHQAHRAYAIYEALCDAGLLTALTDTRTPVEALDAAAGRLEELLAAPWLYLAAMTPNVGQALAQWLRSAHRDALEIGPDPCAVAVAAALLNVPVPSWEAEPETVGQETL